MVLLSQLLLRLLILLQLQFVSSVDLLEQASEFTLSFRPLLAENLQCFLRLLQSLQPNLLRLAAVVESLVACVLPTGLLAAGLYLLGMRLLLA